MFSRNVKISNAARQHDQSRLVTGFTIAVDQQFCDNLATQFDGGGPSAADLLDLEDDLRVRLKVAMEFMEFMEQRNARIRNGKSGINGTKQNKNNPIIMNEECVRYIDGFTSALDEVL